MTIMSTPLISSNTFYGTVTDNNTPLANQEILLTERQDGIITNLYYEHTNETGGYSFQAKQGMSYEVQVVYPNGSASAGAFTPYPIKIGDNNSTNLDLNIYIPCNGVTFKIANGLTGYPWSVALDGDKISSNSNIIYFNRSLDFNHEYYFTIAPPMGYNSTPTSGGFIINNFSYYESVTFEPSRGSLTSIPPETKRPLAQQVQVYCSPTCPIWDMVIPLYRQRVTPPSR